MTDDLATIRRTVFYRGRVQGVGFRATACDVAERFTVTGFVENLPDGRVRLVAEGAEREVERLLEAIRQAMARNIAGADVAAGLASGEFVGFEIRR